MLMIFPVEFGVSLWSRFELRSQAWGFLQISAKTLCHLCVALVQESDRYQNWSALQRLCARFGNIAIYQQYPAPGIYFAPHRPFGATAFTSVSEALMQCVNPRTWMLI